MEVSSIFDSQQIEMPEDVRMLMEISFKGYEQTYDFSGVIAPIPVWNEMRRQCLSNDIQMNGCGSKSTEAVPDTIWGLRITSICNIHDCTHELSKSGKDCMLSNLLLLRNTVTFINNNSNVFTRSLRRYRAMTYYNFVEEFSKSFCKGYKV